MDKIYQLYISGKPLSFKSRGQVCYSKTHLCMFALKIMLYYMVYTTCITTINLIYFKLHITYKRYTYSFKTTFKTIKMYNRNNYKHCTSNTMTGGKLAIQFPHSRGKICRLQIFPRKRENLIANFPKGRGITTVSSLRKMLSTLLKRNWAAWFILDECTALLFWIKNETGTPGTCFVFY